MTSHGHRNAIYRDYGEEHGGMSGISTGKPAKSITKRTASKEANDPRVPATVTASATLAGEGTMVAQQYDTDVVAWSERQAELLRRRAAGVLVNDTELDWLNLAEEIEAVGASTRRELRNRLVRLLQHLLKWYFQPEHRSPRRLRICWRTTPPCATGCQNCSWQPIRAPGPMRLTRLDCSIFRRRRRLPSSTRWVISWGIVGSREHGCRVGP
jgi:hypothetical protein